VATNFVQPGTTVTMVAPSGGATAGVGILIGQLFGVALETVLEAASFEMAVEGIFTLAKTDELAIAIGDPLYWDDTAKCVNATSSAQKEVGFAMSAVAVTAGLLTVDVLLCRTTRTSVAT